MCLVGTCLTAAQAQWTLLGDNGKAEFYYDSSSIVIQGEKVSVNRPGYRGGQLV